MGTDLTSGKEANIKGALRFLGFLGLIVVFVPAYLLLDLCALRAHGWPRVFHKILSQILGFKIIVRGQVSDKKPTFFVSNHSILFRYSCFGFPHSGSFVAKSGSG